MNSEIEDILNGNFDFSDEDIVIGNVLELFKYATNIRKYLNESTNHIPGYEDYKEKILKNSKLIKESTDEKSKLESTHLKLLSSQEEIERKQNEVDSLRENISIIEKLKLEYASVNIEDLKKEYRKLSREHDEKYAEVDRVKESNKKLQNTINSFNTSIEVLNKTSENELEKIKTIFIKIDEYINAHWDASDNRLATERKRFKTLTEQYSSLLNDTDSILIAIGSTKKELNVKEKELSLLSQKYEKLQKVCNVEFEQNSKYIEMNSSELESLSEELKTGLSKFNSILSEVIGKNEKIKNEIREANS